MEEQYDFSKGRRGPVVPPDPNKERITIRLDRKVLEWFRAQASAAGGGNYQTMINDVLKIHSEGGESKLAEILRQVLREEMAKKPRSKKAS